MKLNISYPATGANKLVEVDDAQKLQVFMDKRISAEVPADSLGDEWKGKFDPLSAQWIRSAVSGAWARRCFASLALCACEVFVSQLTTRCAGYIFRINGGNDLQGFPMKQGVMLPTRVRLLMGDGTLFQLLLVLVDAVCCSC
jgi:small subunit ribosomal protein S6e